MSDLIEDVFGSDLESDEKEDIREEVHRSSKPKREDKVRSGTRRPVAFNDSDDDQTDGEPEKRREKKHRKPISFSDSDDDEPPSTRVAVKRKLDHDALYQSDGEEQPSDEEERLRERELEQERRRRKKRKTTVQRPKKQNKQSKPKKSKKSKSRDEDKDESDAPAGPEVTEKEVSPKPEKPKTAFEQAVEASKAMRRPRQKTLDPAKVDSDCVDFLEKMIQAHDDDVRSLKKGKPALQKVMMLREVELMCLRISHREALLDNMILAVFKSWLEPGYKGALPNMQIRQSLLEILLSIPVDKDWVERLESSQGLGRVIHFMSLREPYEPTKRMAEKLMRRWARPVYKSNANYHDLLEEFERPGEGKRAPKDGIASERRAAREAISKLKTTQERMDEFSQTGKKREQILAVVPQPGVQLYSRLAESEVPDMMAVRTRNGKARIKKHKQTISRLRRINKNAGARAAKPSINGRE